MINVQSVSQILVTTGALTAEECERAASLCEAACNELYMRLKNKQDETCEPVIMACAGIALYNFTLLNGASSSSFSSFKAGDITISESYASKVENAARFRDEAMLIAAPYLTDIDFIFEAVEV